MNTEVNSECNIITQLNSMNTEVNSECNILNQL